MHVIKKLLKAESITEYAIIDYDKLNIINPHLKKEGVEYQSALIVLIPYRHKNLEFADNYNVGLFARCMDYHLYAKMLFDRLIPKLKDEYQCEIKGFADHSPINEKDAACKAGLGFIGKNGLLINDKYGSYVFIAEILFTEKLEESLRRCKTTCLGCGACEKSCPTNALDKCFFQQEKCISAISQKKSKSDAEKKILYNTRTVWGCDICQTVCPHNKNAQYSSIDFFSKDIILNFSENTLKSLSDEEYKNHAFSFRPRSVIEENFLTANGKCVIIDKQL